MKLKIGVVGTFDFTVPDDDCAKARCAGKTDEECAALCADATKVVRATADAMFEVSFGISGVQLETRAKMLLKARRCRLNTSG